MADLVLDGTKKELLFVVHWHNIIRLLFALLEAGIIHHHCVTKFSLFRQKYYHKKCPPRLFNTGGLTNRFSHTFTPRRRNTANIRCKRQLPVPSPGRVLSPAGERGRARETVFQPRIPPAYLVFPCCPLPCPPAFGAAFNAICSSFVALTGQKTFYTLAYYKYKRNLTKNQYCFLPI